jgi:hypothetical protein
MLPSSSCPVFFSVSVSSLILCCLLAEFVFLLVVLACFLNVDKVVDSSASGAPAVLLVIVRSGRCEAMRRR